MSSKSSQRKRVHMPSAEKVQAELSQAKSIDDFFGKEGIFSRLFARTLEEMLEAELSEKLGYEKYEAKGRNSGNSRNGKRTRRVRTSAGEETIEVPRDRNGEFASPLLEERRSNELEEKITALYARGMTTRDIQEMIADIYGVEVTATTISAITDKVWPLVEEWQNRPLASIYPILFLDALYVKLRQEGRIENVAIYIALAVDVDGHKDVLGTWVGDGGEGTKFWLNVLTELQSRGVEDILITCVDGLSGFSEAIEATFPQAIIQRCVIHQIRHTLRYVTWSDQKEFMQDLKRVYKAATREEGETNLLELAEKWGEKYPAAIRSWENNWTELSTFFDFPAEIRRLIYTTNTIEGYNRQLRKVTKNKTVFPTAKSVRKVLYLAHMNIRKKWSKPILNWAKIRNQLAIHFEGRFPL
ncbi:MAG: IS256 family transposase [Candidatus Promineofilum sp.]|uniref:IS256 family transposase n=1 Tax=Promineifilum sp. TaxID=2664178 RepID=UPI002411DBF0|nr:IS256 family transposase [Promineifilum sp.]